MESNTIGLIIYRYTVCSPPSSYTAVPQTANDSVTPNAAQTCVKVEHREHVPSREFIETIVDGESLNFVSQNATAWKR